MQLAGIESFGELARIVNTRNLGERTLRKIGDDSDSSRTMQRLDAIALAEATGLPYNFFALPAERLVAAIETADSAAPAQHERVDASGLDEMRERLAALEEAVRQLAAALPTPAPPDALTRMPEEIATTREERPQLGSAPAPGSRRGARR